jgi:hypothetical protein
MESLNWVVLVLTAVFGIIGLVNNNKKKREEAASSVKERKPTLAGGKPSTAGSPRPKPAGSAFGRMLEELSRQLEEEMSPTASPWPVVRPVASEPPAAKLPEATSHDYYSLEDEYDAMDGREWNDTYSVEEADAESRYVGGEMGGARYGGEMGGARYGGEVVGRGVATARESLAAHTATRESLAARERLSQRSDTSLVPAEEVGIPRAAEPTYGADAVVVDADTLYTSARLREVLGGDFDLRRAVIETEILTPKYI